MNFDEKIIWCAGCGIEFPWGATIIDGRTYCCKDCSEGEPCSCGESLELDNDLVKDKGVIGEMRIS